MSDDSYAAQSDQCLFFFFFLLSVLSMAMCLFIYKCKPNCALMRATSLDALFYAETEEFQHFRFYLRVWGVWRL